ncbi:fumarylacetoacetate hydrolase family protein [Micromonospora sp. CPCC 205711]|uniref:2-keto-4-pentenoate hydratase n=1 Tax=Micromonospora sp. CPCC 205547 TaxID=3122400 RepID=UPI002FF40E54
MTTGTTDPVAAAFRRLRTAAETRTPCPPVRDLIGPDDETLAYAVQRRSTEAGVRDGRRPVGRKVGLTSLAVQRQLGVDRPDFGMLFDDMACAESAVISLDRLLQPRVEAEIAFVLADDVVDPGVTAVTVRQRVAYAVPALEIVDSRIAGWDISFADTVADNGSSGLFVLGADGVPLDAVEPVAVQMTMLVDGVPASTGSGKACLGDPLDALAWLARTALAHGDPLRAGDVVLSGALGPMVRLDQGMHVRADLTGLGSVEATFTTPVTRGGS